jgi:hypothetical protein
VSGPNDNSAEKKKQTQNKINEGEIMQIATINLVIKRLERMEEQVTEMTTNKKATKAATTKLVKYKKRDKTETKREPLKPILEEKDPINREPPERTERDLTDKEISEIDEPTNMDDPEEKDPINREYLALHNEIMTCERDEMNKPKRLPEPLSNIIQRNLYSATGIPVVLSAPIKAAILSRKQIHEMAKQQAIQLTEQKKRRVQRRQTRCKQARNIASAAINNEVRVTLGDVQIQIPVGPGWKAR